MPKATPATPNHVRVLVTTSFDNHIVGTVFTTDDGPWIQSIIQTGYVQVLGTDEVVVADARDGSSGGVVPPGDS